MAAGGVEGCLKDIGERTAVAGNLLDCACEARAPNQTWIADFIYIWTAEGWLYVAAVVDRAPAVLSARR